MSAAKLRHRVMFQARNGGTDAFGGTSEVFTDQFEQFVAFVHLSGSEAVEGARLAGREVYKVKVRANTQTRSITTDSWRLRAASKIYNISSIDIMADRRWVWLRVEAG